MTRRNIKAFFFLIFVSAPGFLGAQEDRLTFPGCSASPLFDPSGNFIIAYQNAHNGLSLAAGEIAAQENAVYDLVSTSSVLSPVIKKDKAGEMGIVWVQYGRGKNEIYFGRLRENRLLSARLIVRSQLPLFSPDLDFDDALNPWITWIQGANQKFSVCVANLTMNTTWIINRPFFASALNPKLLVNGNQGVWVFWTGRDKGRDEIFACLFQGTWSKPCRLNNDASYPHTCPSAGLDGNGNPWVVWSAYDGRDYEIFFSSWNGESWSPEEKITDNRQSDMSPSISFVSGTTPLVVWSQSSGRTGSLCARYKQGSVWSPEIKIVSCEGEAFRFPKLAVLGGRLGMTWESGERVGSLLLSFGDLASMANPAVALQDPPVFNPSLDENQYVGFGDSITFAENQGYIPRLEPLLIQKYGTAKIWNEGYGGETTPEGLFRIEEVLAAHLARFLFLMEGTNDIIFWEISIDMTAFDLEEMALKCLRNGVYPLIATIIPRKDWRWEIPYYRSRIYYLNAKIRQLSEKLGIPLVDQFNVFYYYPEADGGWKSIILPDGVHPNPKGFQVMAEAWFEGIKILPFPPVQLRLERLDNHILFYSQPGNFIRWQNNPKVVPDKIAAYKIYRKERDGNNATFQLLATLPFLQNSGDHKYFDANILSQRKYVYVISILRKDGIEGPCSEMANDSF